MSRQHFYRRGKPFSRFFLIGAFALCTPLFAAGHPAFAGTWKMDAAKSQFGMLPAVSSILDKITQQPSEVVINRTRDGQDLVIDIPLDGTSKDNDILGITMKTQGHWDGDALVVDFAGDRRGRTVTYKERWTLSPDGSSFQVARHLTSPRGETDQLLFMVKQ